MTQLNDKLIYFHELRLMEKVFEHHFIIIKYEAMQVHSLGRFRYGKMRQFKFGITRL